MIALVFVLAVAVLLLVSALLVVLRLKEPRAVQDLTPIAVEPPETPRLLTSRSRADGVVEVVTPEGDVLLELSPIRFNAAGSKPAQSSSMGPALLTGLVGIGGEVASLLTSSRAVRLVFKKDVLQMLKKGTAELMTSGGPSLGIARSVKTGRIVGVAAVKSASLPSATVLFGAAVQTAVVLELVHIEAMLRHIQRDILALAQRERDDDHGQIAAANALVAQLIPLLIDGVVPEQYALELAVARQGVEAVYYSRQHFVNRFSGNLESAQVAEDARRGEAKAWASGAIKAFGKIQVFREEVLLYAEALATRARLALCTAAVLAVQGHPESGAKLLASVQDEVLDGFHDLSRRLRALSIEEPSLLKVPGLKRQDVYDTARDLTKMFDTQVQPLLPKRSTGVLELTINTDEVD